MKILFYDFETNSKDPNLAAVLEAGVAIYSERGRLLRSGSEVFQQAEFSDEILEIVDLAAREIELGLHASGIQRFLEPFFLDEVDMVVGHNILSYDNIILSRFDGKRLLSGKTIVDTMIDLPYPARTTSKRLTHLCADHHISTPNAHGALYDCIYTAELFFKYDLEEIRARANTPLVWIKADCGFSGKDRAKKHGFKYDASTKSWVKQVRMADREKLLEKVGNDFPMIRLPDTYLFPRD